MSAKKIVPWNKGKHLSEEHKQKIAKAALGKPHVSDEAKKRLSELRQGKNNPIWKDKPKYSALHLWVRSHFWKPSLCQMCLLVSPHDLANITNVYNRDFKNWRYYCRSCHMKSDKRILNLKQYQSSCSIA